MKNTLALRPTVLQYAKKKERRKENLTWPRSASWNWSWHCSILAINGWVYPPHPPCYICYAVAPCTGNTTVQQQWGVVARQSDARINLQVYGINKCRSEIMISSSCAIVQKRTLPSPRHGFLRRPPACPFLCVLVVGCTPLGLLHYDGYLVRYTGY